MEQIFFETTTAKPFAQVRRDMDRALDASLAAPVLSRRWGHNSLSVSAPGTRGQVRLEGRRLRARVQVTPPATFIRAELIRDISRILAQASGNRVRVTSTQTKK